MGDPLPAAPATTWPNGVKKVNVATLPPKSQTGAARDGNYFPCCYLGDMWCKGTNQQKGIFNDDINWLASVLLTDGKTFDNDSDDNLCKQMGCHHW